MMTNERADEWYLEQAGRYADELSDLAGEIGTDVSVAAPPKVVRASEGRYVQAWIYVPDPESCADDLDADTVIHDSSSCANLPPAASQAPARQPAPPE